MLGQSHGTGTSGRIITSVPVSETKVHNNSASSIAAKDVIIRSAGFVLIVKKRCQFVAALEVAELSCTIVSGTAIGIISLSQGPATNAIVGFAAALEEAELICTIISDTGTYCM